MDYDAIEIMAMSVANKALIRLHEEKAQRFASKIQVTKPEIVEMYDAATFRDLVELGLRVIRQNGPGGKKYYSTKKVLDLTNKWIHIKRKRHEKEPDKEIGQ